MVSLATIVIGVYLIHDGLLSMGGLIACYLLSSRAMAPIGQVAGLLVQYHSAATAFESLARSAPASAWASSAASVRARPRSRS
jgi:ATP-binding cassette subfamily C protein LapB